MLLQHWKAVPGLQELAAVVPLGLQVQIVCPAVLVVVAPWQHLSQLSFFLLLPRGFLDGHCLPDWMQAWTLTLFFLPSARALRFLLSATAVTPTAARAPPAIPCRALRRLWPLASLATSSSNCLESTEASPFRKSHRGRYRGSGGRQ